MYLPDQQQQRRDEAADARALRARGALGKARRRRQLVALLVAAEQLRRRQLHSCSCHARGKIFLRSERALERIHIAQAQTRGLRLACGRARPKFGWCGGGRGRGFEATEMLVVGIAERDERVLTICPRGVDVSGNVCKHPLRPLGVQRDAAGVEEGDGDGEAPRAEASPERRAASKPSPISTPLTALMLIIAAASSLSSLA